ncbi:MAG: hypothetical protein AAGJ81_12900 [Verrucomicrobiota bacterium]
MNSGDLTLLGSKIPKSLDAQAMDFFVPRFDQAIRAPFALSQALTGDYLEREILGLRRLKEFFSLQRLALNLLRLRRVAFFTDVNPIHRETVLDSGYHSSGASKTFSELLCKKTLIEEREEFEPRMTQILLRQGVGSEVERG